MLSIERFERLSEEKRARFMKSVKKEFASNPYEEISVNRISRGAGISRACFYTYFKNKDELLAYILESYQKCALSRFEKWNGGDAFDLALEMLSFTAEFDSDEHNRDLFRNIFAHLKMADSESVLCMKDRFLSERFGEMKARFAGGLDIRTEGDLENMIDIVFLIVKNAVSEMFAEGSLQSEILQKTADKFAILKRGMALIKD